MSINLLNKIPFALATMAATSVAFGAMSTNERVAQLETQMKQVRTETAMDTYGANTASARPEVDGQGWFISFDVLYWHPKVGGSEYAYSDDSPALTTTPGIQAPPQGFPVKGRTKDIGFSWDWGFKAQVGYNFDHDGWDAGLQYTRLDSSGSDSTRAGQNSTVVPLKGSSNIVSAFGGAANAVFLFCDSAKSEFDVDFDRLDLELGRNFFVSSKVSLRPFAGLTAAWVDLDQNTRYTGGSADGNNLGLGINTVHIKDSSNFEGLGPRFGIDSKWHLGYGFSLFGNISGALLYGHHDVNHRERFSPLEQNRISLNADNNRFAPNAMFELGLVYDAYLNDNKQHVGVSMGFEGQYWWRMNQMLKIDDFAVLKYERYSEDVSFHGLTIEIRLDF